MDPRHAACFDPGRQQRDPHAEPHCRPGPDLCGPRRLVPLRRHAMDRQAADRRGPLGHRRPEPLGAQVLRSQGRRRPVPGPKALRAGIKPQILGGGQENGLRSGTLNVPAIVGLGVASQLAMDRQEADAIRIDQLARTLFGRAHSPRVRRHAERPPSPAVAGFFAPYAGRRRRQGPDRLHPAGRLERRFRLRDGPGPRLRVEGHWPARGRPSFDPLPGRPNDDVRGHRSGHRLTGCRSRAHAELFRARLRSFGYLATIHRGISCINRRPRAATSRSKTGDGNSASPERKSESRRQSTLIWAASS